MRFFISIFFIIISSVIKAQSISGFVTDSVSKKPVTNAYILNEKMSPISSTNQDGYFSIPDIKGIEKIFISHVAYYTYILDIKNASSLKNLHLTMLPTTIILDSVIVSADLNNSSQKDLQIFARTIGTEELKQTPSTNIDLYLRKIPGINVNRSWGIFSKNASITMRGLTNSASVLVTLDGVPLNKLAGGSVNWNLMSSSSLSRIEVVKGPNSAQYGMNAMGGCVNLQGHVPKKKFEGALTLSGGTYNSKGSSLYLGGLGDLKKLKYYWSIDASYRSGDGYIYFPSNAPSPIAQKTYLNEYSTLVKTGILWNSKHITNVGFLYSKDKRGEGIKVYESDGSFNSYNTNILWLKHNYSGSKINISLLSFINLENYFRKSENINTSGSYQYFETNSKKGDRGVKLT